MAGSGKAKAVSPGEDFGGVSVKVNGDRVEVHTDRSIALYTNSSVDVYTNSPVRLHPANDDAKVKAELQIGDLDDGGVYVGLSAEDGRPLHAALADLPEYKTYEGALAAADQLKSAHPSAHVPTPQELAKNLFENRSTGHLKGTFNTSGSYPSSVYRSDAPYGYTNSRVHWFGVDFQGYVDRRSRLPVRLVW
jgi:hypothetical protein